MKHWFLALSLSLLIPNWALAQPAAPTADPKAAAEGADPEEKPAEPKETRRPYTSTQFDMENMSDMEFEQYGKMAKIREDSVRKLKDLVESAPNHPAIADLYYRIAEYITENVRYAVAVQARAYRQAVKDFESGAIKEEPVPPVKDYSETLAYYEKILIEHKDYPKAEDVLYYLGRNGLETGRSKGDDNLSEQSIKYLDKLAELFPQSKHLPSSALMSAEYFFAKNKLAEALAYYKKVVDNYKTDGGYLYSLYKLGWVYYNYQQYEQTLAAFEEVITKLREQGKAEDTLRQMTVKDYLITTSEAGLGWSRFKDYMKAELGENGMHEVLFQLGQLMVTNSFNEDAIAIFQYFVNLDPLADECVDYWNRILDVYRYSFPFAQTEAKVFELQEFFKQDGAWWQKNSGTNEFKLAAEDLLVKWDLSLAEYYLEEGLYFNKGDVAFQTAISRLKEIIEKGAKGRQEQAWAGILVGYTGLIRSESKGRVIYVAENVFGPTYPEEYKMPRKPLVTPMNPSEAAFVEALEKYLALGSTAGQKPALKPMATVDMKAMALYTGALVYYMRGKFAESLALLDKLIAHNVKTDYTRPATDIIFQTSGRTGDWAGLQRRMKTLLENAGEFVDPVQATDFLCQGMINEGLAQAEAKTFADATSKLGLAADTCKENQDRGPEALYQLGQVAEKAGFFDQARKAYERLQKDYPASKMKAMAKRRFDAIKNK